MTKRHVAFLLGTILVVGLAVGLGRSQSQDQGQASGSAAPEGRMQPRSPDQVVNFLGEKLNLTDAQKSQIKPIIEDRQQHMEKIRADTSLSQTQRRQAMRNIMETSNTKINAVLNDQQKQQYAELQQQMRQQMQERRQNQNAPEGGGQKPQE